MRISEKGKQLIKSYEGCRLVAYLCPANVWTIGWGHTGDVYEGQTITQAEADRLFDNDIKRYEVPAKYGSFNQNQFDALTSFAYNCGMGALDDVLTSGDITGTMLLYVNGGGVQLPGLVRRRKEEVELYNTPVATVPPVSSTTGKILRIKYASSWAVYPLGVAPVKENTCGSLNPRDFGTNGILEYAILDTPAANMVTIQTKDYGQVNIYLPVGDSEWEIINATAKSIYVNLRDFMTSWRVYELDAPAKKGYETGFLNPSLGTKGGLSYKVIDKLGADIYSIKTETYGVVKIYCPNDNEGSVKASPLYELV